MKLYLLRPVKPWEPGYDKAAGFIVRAKTARQARDLASNDAGDEGPGVWLNPKDTTCEIVTAAGAISVLIRDFHAA